MKITVNLKACHLLNVKDHRLQSLFFTTLLQQEQVTKGIPFYSLS